MILRRFAVALAAAVMSVTMLVGPAAASESCAPPIHPTVDTILGWVRCE